MKIVNKDEIVRMTEQGIKDDIDDLENNVFPLLKHGEKTRLFLAEIKYPLEEIDFEDEPEMQRANIILRRLKDSLVALGTEVVIDQLLSDNNKGESDEPKTNEEI